MEDRGAHYRYKYNGIKLDPYRISRVYGLSGPREHAVKKLLRGTDKGHTEKDMWLEIIATATRAIEMIEEDENPAAFAKALGGLLDTNKGFKEGGVLPSVNPTVYGGHNDDGMV
jgi:hypothetical protein